MLDRCIVDGKDALAVQRADDHRHRIAVEHSRNQVSRCLSSVISTRKPILLADGRVILIEERLTEDGGVIGLRVDITELKQREASFRLLFDGNPVPMIVCALDGEHILGVNDAAIEHYGYSRAEFEKLTIRSLQAFDSELPWTGDRSSDEQAARTWKHVRADGTLIDLAIYSRQLVHGDQPAVLLALMDITERKRAEARLAFMAQHDGLTGLPNRNLLRQQMDEILLHTRRSAEKVARAGARPRQFQGGQRHARPRRRRQAAARRRQAPALDAARGGRAGAPQLRRIRDRAERAWRGPRTRCCWRGACWRRSAIPICSTAIPS